MMRPRRFWLRVSPEPRMGGLPMGDAGQLRDSRIVSGNLAAAWSRGTPRTHPGRSLRWGSTRPLSPR
eukprot:730234-Prorocentrum_minimum.AAC.1